MAPRRCPPGVWCLTPEFAVAVVVLLVLGASVYFYQISRPSLPKVVSSSQQRIQPSVFEPPEPAPPVVTTNVRVINEDSRYRRAPEPLRNWLNPPDLRGALIPQGATPIFQPSVGYPEQFQQMGILTTEDTKQILPLFGRRTGSSNTRYNYYTRTDTYNPIQLPIRYERRDCMDDVGCNELLGNEKVYLDGIDKEANVKIYRYDAPRYIPAVF
jgi:hypothetical protein